MFDAYYYMLAKEVKNAVDCGIKLSQWFTKEVKINAEMQKCISALLTPRDDLKKLRSEDYKCVKLSVLTEYCFIADKSLYFAGLSNELIYNLYLKSIMPAESYKLGDYRLPEVLITTTVINSQISLSGKRLDTPILYDNSEKLFINNVLENYKNEDDDFDEKMLYCFYSKLASVGVIEKFEDIEKNVAVFFDKKQEKL